MTLNLTVTTRRCIYQSADYRLRDLRTGRTFDFETQKIALVNTFGWSATVCFADVGRTHNLDVSEWLADRVASIQPDDPFERLLDELLTANDWLSTVPTLHDRRHSFSVGAFVGSEPVFALVSNFEQPSSLAAATASSRLSVYKLRPTKPKAFVSGQKQAVDRSERRRLAALAARAPDPERMYSALADVNRGAATRTTLVSPACFTAHVRLTGEGGGLAHDIGDRPFLPNFAIPAGAQEAITRVLDQRFGPGGARLVGISTSRADQSDEYHETQLREKPEDPSTHSNYGAFLMDKKGDLEGAERAYRMAIELDDNHVNALGNLANLLWEKGDRDQAANLYRRALKAGPGDENVTWNYARFLLAEFDDRQATREVLHRGITTHPESGRLLLLRADLSLRDGNALEALEGFRRAREKGADQAAVESGYAFALQLSGAPIGECIAAYRVALGLNPEDGALRLNLAQLMFIKGDDMEANKHLLEAMRSGLDESAQLEAHFYRLSHTSSDPAEILQVTKSLLTRGARLRWDVRPNIETVSQHDPQKAVLLEIGSKVMAGEHHQVSLDQVLARWPSRR
jgi:Flp pilus assembly protein TadD